MLLKLVGTGLLIAAVVLSLIRIFAFLQQCKKESENEQD